jgi:hypothetical protein
MLCCQDHEEYRRHHAASIGKKKHLCGLLEKFTNGNLQNAPAAHLKILLPLALVLL